MENSLQEKLKSLADNAQETVYSNSMLWLQEVAQEALSVLKEKDSMARPLVFTDESLMAFYQNIDYIENTGVIHGLEKGIHAVFKSLAPYAYAPVELSNKTLENFYSIVEVEKTGIVQELQRGLRSVAMSTPALCALFPTPVKLTGTEILDVSRASGLRSSMHGVDASKAQEILVQFLSELDSRKSSLIRGLPMRQG